MKNLIVGLCACLITLPVLAADPVAAVVIGEEVPFSNKDAVDGAIVAECNLPQRQAQLLVEQLKAAGIETSQEKNLTPKAGANVLKLEIATAVSGGNAFTGHSKFVTVTGILFQNGKEAGKFVATRKSGGGAFGGYKGSCAVLGRCAQAIGKDIAGWLKSPVDGAKLGDAR